MRVFKVARSAISGRFITARDARRRRSTTVVETYGVSYSRLRVRGVKRAAKAKRS